MMKTKFLTSVCVILAGLYGTAYGAASLRAGTMSTGAGTTATAARAGTLRAKSVSPSISKSSVSSTAAKTAGSSDSARLSSLPGIGANKLSISPKLPSAGYSVVSASEIEDLRKELAGVRSEIDTSLNEVFTSIDTVERVASVAAEKAETAHTKAETAETVATTAQTTAETAQSKAITAQTTAETASATATTASATAQTASGTADEAKVTAQNALSAANIDLGLRISGDKVEYTTKANAETPTWKEAAKKSIFEGVDGKTPVISADAEKVFYTYEGEEVTEANKKPIVNLAAIKGPQGADGATPILENDKDNKRLTIKYAADEPPVQLVSYSDIGAKMKIKPATETTPTQVCESDAENADCVPVLSPATADLMYLKSADAETTYLKSTDAATTYAPKNILSNVKFKTTETEVQYAVENDENGDPIYKKLASKSEFSGTVGADGKTPAIRTNYDTQKIEWAHEDTDKPQEEWDWKTLINLSDITGSDACTAVTTSYTDPDETGAQTVDGVKYYIHLGYTTVTTTNKCDPTQNTSYTQDDVCVVANVDRTNNKDIFLCKKQDDSGEYNYVKTDEHGLHSIFDSLISEKKQEYVAPTPAGCGGATEMCTAIGYMKIYDTLNNVTVKDTKNREIVSRVDDTCIEEEYTDNNIKLYRRKCTKQEFASGSSDTYYMASELNIIPTTDQNYTQPKDSDGNDCTANGASCSKIGFYKVCSATKTVTRSASVNVNQACSVVEDQCDEVEDSNASTDDNVTAYKRKCTRQGGNKDTYYLDSDLNKIPTSDQNYVAPDEYDAATGWYGKLGYMKVCTNAAVAAQVEQPQTMMRGGAKATSTDAKCSQVYDSCEEVVDSTTGVIKTYKRQCTRQDNQGTYYMASDLNNIPTSDHNYTGPQICEGSNCSECAGRAEELCTELGYYNICTGTASELVAIKSRGGVKGTSNAQCSKAYDTCVEEAVAEVEGKGTSYRRTCTRQDGQGTYYMASGIASTIKDYVKPTKTNETDTLYATVGYTEVCTGKKSADADGGKKGTSQQNSLCSRSEDRCVDVREKDTGTLVRHCTVQDGVSTDEFTAGDAYDVAIGGIAGGNYSCETTTQTYHGPGTDATTPTNNKGYMLVVTEDKCAGTEQKQYKQYDTCVLSSLYVPGDDNENPDEPTDNGKSGTRGTSTQNNGKDTYTCTRQDDQKTYDVELYSTGAVLAGVSDKISGLQTQLSSKLDASNLSFEKSGNTLVLKSGDTTLNVSGLDNLKGDRGHDAANAFNYLGDVDSYNQLPDKNRPNTTEALQQGDGFLNNADGRVYVWNGTGYPSEGNGIPWKGETGQKGDDPCTQISTTYTPGCILDTNGKCQSGKSGVTACGDTPANACTKAGYMTVTSTYTNSASCPNGSGSNTYTQEDTCMLSGLNAGANNDGSGDYDIYTCTNQSTNGTYSLTRAGAGSVAHAILGMSINNKTLREVYETVAPVNPPNDD